jgi:primosomal protein N' (replication factor Y) (superfamily II helicase)
MGLRLVEVAIPRPVWRTFTYMLPERLDGGRLEGCRVAVEFGNQKLIGHIWGDASRAPSESLKQVLDRLDPSPLLPPRVWSLVKWTAKYYIAPPGHAASAALPPGLSGRAVRMLAAEGGVPEALAGILGKGRPVRADRLAASLPDGFPLEENLRKLEREGALRVWWQPDHAAGPSPARILVAAATPEDLVREGEKMRRRSPARAALLLLLAGSGKASRREALARTGISPAAVRALISAGLVSETHDPGPRPVPPLPQSLVMGGTAVALEPVEDQRKALEEIRATRARGGGVLMLRGITGSGKTEVYLQAIAGALEDGRSALVLVPEISLTPQLVARFSARFPDSVAVLHSGLCPSDRLSFWSAVRSGARRIAIGARSAVFAPLEHIGVLVVDEEHDPGYKQEEHPRYNARDLAVIRGRLEGAAVILGSASPSLESWGNTATGKYGLVELRSRIDGRSLPRTSFIRESEAGKGLLSEALLREIGNRLDLGEQTIILINRRGFSPAQICRVCGRREDCPDCGIPLTYHRRGSVLRCHWCGHWAQAPMRCPECGSESFAREGPGVQRVELELNRAFPAARILRMDSDTVAGSAAHWEILERFGGGGGDILVGTQMVAKGHDFPGVTLTGILAADMSLSLPDFRARERTFSLILQAAGRAGRGDRGGQVIVQASNPGDPVIIAAAEGDFLAFAAEEMGIRSALGFPPSTAAARFLWTGSNADRVAKAASFGDCPIPEGVRVLGPSAAVIPRIGGTWRWNALALSASRSRLHSFAERVMALASGTCPPGVRIDVDIDPSDLL